MNLESFKRVEVIGERPEKAPEGWVVFNAPRPLWATNDPNPVTWEGDPVEGRHFAAVDPQDPHGHLWVKHNRRQRAVIVTWVSREDHRARVKEYALSVHLPRLRQQHGDGLDVEELVGMGAPELDTEYRFDSPAHRIYGPLLSEV